MVVPRSSVLFENYSNTSEELTEANSKIVELEARLKDLTVTTAKEISTLKAKLAKQDAALIISSNNNAGMDNSSVIERPSSMSKFNQSISSNKNVLVPLGGGGTNAMPGSNQAIERSQRGSFSGGLQDLLSQNSIGAAVQPKIGRLPSNLKVTQSYDEGSIFNYSKRK